MGVSQGAEIIYELMSASMELGVTRNFGESPHVGKHDNGMMLCHQAVLTHTVVIWEAHFCARRIPRILDHQPSPTAAVRPRDRLCYPYFFDEAIHLVA